MTGRPDGMSVTVGLLFGAIAAVGLWSAVGTVDWALVGVGLPVALVAIGVLGINLSRHQ